jgi:predicted dehydrogenase
MNTIAGEPIGARAVRVAVVGVGHVGRHHARIYAGLRGVELVAVVDRDRARAEAVAGLYGAAVADRPDELVGRIDAASVAVPTSDHQEVAQQLLAGGVDVLVEKPLAGSVQAARDLVALAERSGRILMPGHPERFNPAIAAAAALVDRPLFIESQRLSPFTERSLDIDVIMDLMIHDLDIILWLVRAPVVRVDAVGVAVLSATVDIANARLEFEGGCVANLTASRVSADRLRKLRCFQPAGYLSVDYTSQELKRLIVVRQPDGRPRIEAAALPVPKAEPLERELEAFIAAVRRRQSPAITAREALASIELAFEVQRAMEARAQLQLP